MSMLRSAALAVAGALVSGAAFAGTVSVTVPEPMTMGLLAAGAAGLYAIRRFRGK